MKFLLSIYVGRIQEIQNNIQDLNYIRSQLEMWIASDDYPDFIVAKFYSLMNQIDEILKLLNLMIAKERYSYFFSNEYFVEISLVPFVPLIPFILVYPYPVSIIVDFFNTVSYYSDSEYQDYEDDEDSLFYNLLEILSDYISSIDAESTGDDAGDVSDKLNMVISWHTQQKNNKLVKKNKPKP